MKRKRVVVVTTIKPNKTRSPLHTLLSKYNFPPIIVDAKTKSQTLHCPVLKTYIPVSDVYNIILEYIWPKYLWFYADTVMRDDTIFRHSFLSEMEMNPIQDKFIFSEKSWLFAAEKGFVPVLKYLQEKTNPGCTSESISWAANNGHLDAVMYLHENCKQCSAYYQMVGPNAIDMASKNGHLPIVEYLTQKKYPCTTAAMDNAAEKGHLHILKFLRKHRKEGCTFIALKMALEKKRDEIVEWLINNGLHMYS